MPFKVKSVTEAGKFWVEGAGARAPRYGTETPAAASLWEENTSRAGKNYKDGVSAIDIDKRFSGGVKRVGATKFGRKVTSVGIARFKPGVEAAKGDYEAGVTPMLETIATVTDPGRKLRGDPDNIKRVTAIADALHKKRLALRAAG